MTTSALNSAVEKLEAANLTDDEIESLAEALALTIAHSNSEDDEVQGFSARRPGSQDFSFNFEEVKVTLRDQIRTPGNIWVVVEGYTDPGRYQV